MEPRLIDPMLSPFIQYFLFQEVVHTTSILGVIVILFSGVLVGIKKVYFDPTRSKQTELVSIHEINGSEDNDGEVDEHSKSSSKKYTTDKVEYFNDKSSKLEIELGSKPQSQKIAWG